MTISDKFHSRNKHLEVDHHFIKERVSAEEIITKYVPSEEQLTDIFTKPLPRTSKNSEKCWGYAMDVQGSFYFILTINQTPMSSKKK